MDNTSPEHDALVARAITNRRLYGNACASHSASEQIRLDWILAEIRSCLRDTDAQRYTVEQAAPNSTLHYLVDRWPSHCGDISDWGDDPAALRASAERMNATNAEAGRADLAERLDADAAARARVA